MKYKAIFSDFDGTLYGTDYTVSQKNRDAIKDYISLGGKFYISTGRLFKSIYPHLVDLDLEGYVITSQGAEIYDIKSKNLVHGEYISKESTIKSLEFIEKQMIIKNIHYIAYQANEIISSERNAYADRLSNIVKIDYKITNEKLSSYFTHQKVMPSKILALMDMPLMDEFVKEGEKQLKDVNFAKSREFLVEIQAKDIDKGKGVKKVCELENISLSDVICIGDSENDLGMLNVAGLSVATNNAYTHVKERCKYIAPSCDEDAIYDVIEKFCKE